MGKRIQAAEEFNSQNDNTISGNSPQPYCSKASRRPGESIDSVDTARAFVSFIKKKFPHLAELFNRLTDARKALMCRYTPSELVWSALLMFLCRAGSRNKADAWRDSGNLPGILMQLAGRDLQKEPVGSDPRISCSDNVARYLSHLCPSELEEALVTLVRGFIEKRTFDNSRLQGKMYILVVDGSVREKCRRKFDKHGLQRGGARYHYVLRIDILLEGIAIPLIHEHIDMQDPEREKEDCEINASKRALMRLKMAFPRLPIMLLGDSLYACRPIAHLCKEMNWDYCFTLKEGRTPAVWQEVQKLMELTRENRYEYSVTTDGERHKRTGKLRWVEDVDFSDNIHKKLSCSVIEQRETFKGVETYYAWITSLKNINTSTVLACVQSTGRKRHTIEDQLNSQKNNGYGLEHVFCANENAGKNYYTIMQIAVLLWTLFYDGLLKRVFKWAKTWSQIAIAMMLREGLRLMHRNTKDFKFAQLRFGT